MRRNFGRSRWTWIFCFLVLLYSNNFQYLRTSASQECENIEILDAHNRRIVAQGPLRKERQGEHEAFIIGDVGLILLMPRLQGMQKAAGKDLGLEYRVILTDFEDRDPEALIRFDTNMVLYSQLSQTGWKADTAYWLAGRSGYLLALSSCASQIFQSLRDTTILLKRVPTS